MPHFLLRLFKVLLICLLLGFMMTTFLQMLNMVIAFPPKVADFIAEPVWIILLTTILILPTIWRIFGSIDKKKKIRKA